MLKELIIGKQTAIEEIGNELNCRKSEKLTCTKWVRNLFRNNFTFVKDQLRLFWEMV